MEEGKHTQYTTILQCFCNMKGKALKDELYSNAAFHPEKTAICAYYYKDKLNSKLLGTSISFIIIAINIILRGAIISLIESIRHDTQSEKLASITNGVFVAQFFNTGFLLLLVNANMTEHRPQFLTQFVSTGKWYDYMPLWYKDVGAKIVKTMIINCIMPYITLGTCVCVPKIKQWLDGGHYKTKKTSMAMFKMLYGGADYVIHFKYSNVLNIVYITMMYGMGMPILFPVAVINFLNQYFCERVIVAYCMKQPPALDDKLIRNCIKMLRWAPLFFLANGYWMVTNPQIFDNAYFWIDRKSDYMKSGHSPGFKENYHGLPLLWFTFAHIIIIVIMIIASEWMKRLGFSFGQKDIEIDEDLPNFFKAVSLSQANEVVERDKYLKDHFGFEQNDPDTIEKLDSTKMPKKSIQGTPWYHVTSNSDYANMFGYIGPHVKERWKLIEDGDKARTEKNEKGKKVFTLECKRDRLEQSDLVMILLNLAYLPDEVVRKVDFSVEQWSVKFLKDMKAYKVNWEE